MRITGYRLYLTRRDPFYSMIYDYRTEDVPENLPVDGDERTEAINRLFGDILLHSSSVTLAPLLEGWREVTSIVIDLPDTVARNGNYIALDIEGVGTRFYFVTKLMTISSGKCALQLTLDTWANYHEYLSNVRGAISRAHVDRYRRVDDDTYYPILNPYTDSLTDGIAVHTTTIKPRHHWQLKDNGGSILDDDTQIVWAYRKLNVNSVMVKLLPDTPEEAVPIKGVDYFNTGLPVVATPVLAIASFSDPTNRHFYPVSSIYLNGVTVSDANASNEIGESSSLYINSWLSLVPPVFGNYHPTLIGGEVLLKPPAYVSRVLGAYHSITADNVEVKLSPITIIEANQSKNLIPEMSLIDTLYNHRVSLSDIENGDAPESKIHGIGYDEHGFIMGDMYCPFDYSRPNVFSTFWYTKYGEYPVSDIIARDGDGNDEIIKTVSFMPTSALPTSVDQAELFLRSSGESYYLAKANAKRDASLGIGSGIFKGITKALTAKNVGGVIGGVSSAIGAGVSGGIKLSDIERNHEAKMADLGNALDAITVPSRNSIEALSYNADILLKVEKSVDPESRDRITRTWRLKGYPINLFGDVIRRNRKWFDYVSAIDLTPPSFDGFTPDEIPLASEFDRFAVAMSRGVMILHLYTEHDHPRPGGEGLGDWAIAPPSIPFDSMPNPERSLIQ